MKYGFYYTDESRGIDNLFYADLTIIPGERDSFDNPGCPAQIDVDDIYFADNPSKKISESLYKSLKIKIDNLYEDILATAEKEAEEWKAENKIDFD
jgi:hypothetical protein